MEMFSRKLRKYAVTLSVVVLLVLVSAFSAFAAAVPGTEESSSAAESSSVENSAPVESSTAAEESTEDETGESTGNEGEESDEIKALEVLEHTVLTTEEESYTYNGASITPAVRLIYTEPTTNEEIDVTDYYIVDVPVYGEDNVNAGTVPVAAAVSGYYETSDDGQQTEVHFSTGAFEVKGSYTIEPMSLKNASLTLGVSSVTYNGKSRKPSTSVIVALAAGETKLIGGSDDDTDYQTVYTNNKNAGTATVTVVGKNNFKDSVEATFTIEPMSIKDASLKLGVTSVTYNGKSRKPSTSVVVALANGNKKLTGGSADDADYQTTYKDNKNAGTATVTVTGKNNFKDSVSTTFKITKKDISTGTISLSATKYTYNGKDRKPTAKVKIQLVSSSSAKTLTKGTDYTITYSSNCKSLGTKTVTIKGTGNYTGSLKKNYLIVPEKASGLKVSERTTSALTATCTAAKNSGCKYQFIIKQYNSSKETWERLSSKQTSSNSVTFSGLTAGRAYKIYVRIYKKTDSKSYIGPWSSALTTVTTPAKPVISSAVKTGDKTMKVSWKAVSLGSGYEIQYSTSSDFSSNTKIVTVSGRTTTSKSISLGTTNIYYARVRAYRTCGDSTYRGAWSSKVSTSMSNVYASYSTTYDSSNTNRSTNLRLACNAINGTILSNGSTFSFNGIVGERTAAKGYKEAIIYEGGQEVGGIGGGICQVATTLFNAALKANFQIVERHQHSLTVHYVPLGYDAAIAWGSKNLRFKNNSGVSIKVQTVASGGTLSVKFLTDTAKKPPTVTTKVTVRNGVYTLKRYVNGECNYTTTSDYLDN